MAIKYVIVSRKRPYLCQRASYQLFPQAVVSVAEEEAGQYIEAGIDKKRLLVHPDDVVGIAKKRNWVLRNVKEETVVMVDDDCVAIICMVGQHYRRIREPEAIHQIMLNSEAAARAIGTVAFFLNSMWDIRKARPHDPFGFVGYPSGIMGIIGRTVWFDDNQLIHDDVDFALEVIRKYRVVWIDKRFGYMQKVSTTVMAGGCQGLISEKRDRLERRYLKAKWGKYYKMEAWSTTGVKSTIYVERKQNRFMGAESV